ncbi:hypothetical protein KR450_23695, partial [Escherichia coli]|uniref:hypothetical protein n=1 Tax=Escherichia coli TaxID=562 RepID=UPI001C37EAF0
RLPDKRKSPEERRILRGLIVERLDQSTGVIMTKRRKKYQEKEEIRHPDSPEGLVVAAANNRAFAERLVGVYRLAKAGVKHGRR